MKKIITTSLILVLVFSLGLISYGHLNGARGSFSNTQGFGPGMMNGVYDGNNAGIEILSELTGLTSDEIYEKGLPLHVVAEEEGYLEEFLEKSLNNRIESIEVLVEEGSITEAYGTLLIERMTEMHEYMSSDEFINNAPLRNTSGGYTGNIGCGRRW